MTVESGHDAPCALAGSLLGSQLFNVRSFDPFGLLLTIGVLGPAATDGAWLPARRVSRFEPTLVLRRMSRQLVGLRIV